MAREQRLLTVDTYRHHAAGNIELRAEVTEWLMSLVPWAAQRGLLVMEGVIYLHAFAWRPDGPWLLCSPLKRNGAYNTTTNPDGQTVLIHSWVPSPVDPPRSLHALADVLAVGESIPGIAPVGTFKVDAPVESGLLMPWEVSRN